MYMLFIDSFNIIQTLINLVYLGSTVYLDFQVCQPLSLRAHIIGRIYKFQDKISILNFL